LDNIRLTTDVDERKSLVLYNTTIYNYTLFAVRVILFSCWWIFIHRRSSLVKLRISGKTYRSV